MRIVPARLTHVGPLATKMREEDRRECLALGRTPKEALRMGLKLSLYAMTAIEDSGEVTAMFGLNIVSAIEGRACPWFLGTDRVFMHGRDLLCTGGRILSWWRSEYPYLENLVSVENVRAIRLLRRWGFSVGGREEVHRGVAFVPFRSAIQAVMKAA